MTDFTKMTGQEVCQWLEDHGVVFGSECVLTKTVTMIDPQQPNPHVMEEVGFWNLPACAFEAMKWCREHNYGVSFWNKVRNLVYDPMTVYWLNDFDETTWLIAAATVIEGNIK